MATVFLDTFNVAVNTNLNSHAPDVGTSWTALSRLNTTATLQAVSVSDTCRMSASDTTCGMIYTADVAGGYGSADYTVEITITAHVTSNSTTDSYGIAARCTNTSNAYIAYRNGNAQAIFIKRVGAVRTVIGTLNTVAESGNRVLKIVCSGTTITAYYDGVEIGTDTAGDITAEGEAAVVVGSYCVASGGCSATWTGDDFTVTTADPVSVEVPVQTGAEFTCYAPTVTIQSAGTSVEVPTQTGAEFTCFAPTVTASVGARQYFMNSSTTRITTTSTSMVDALSLTFTPDANTTYFFFYAGTVDVSGSPYYVAVELYETTDAVQIDFNQPNASLAGANLEKVGFAALGVYTFGSSPGSRTVKMRYSVGGSTGGIADMYIVAIRKEAYDAYVTDAAGATFTANAYTAYEKALSFTPPSSGDYLIVANPKGHANVAGVSAWSTRLYDQTGAAALSTYENFKTEAYGTDNHASVFMMDKVTLSAAREYRIQAKSDDGSSTASVKYVTFAALRMDLFYDNLYGEDRTESSTTSSTYQSKLALGATTFEAVDYLVLASSKMSSNNRWKNQLFMDLGTGTDATLMETIEWAYSNDWKPAAFAGGMALDAATTRNFIIQYGVTDGGNTGYIQEAVAIVIKLENAVTSQALEAIMRALSSQRTEGFKAPLALVSQALSNLKDSPTSTGVVAAKSGTQAKAQEIPTVTTSLVGYGEFGSASQSSGTWVSALVSRVSALVKSLGSGTFTGVVTGRGTQQSKVQDNPTYTGVLSTRVVSQSKAAMPGGFGLSSIVKVATQAAAEYTAGMELIARATARAKAQADQSYTAVLLALTSSASKLTGGTTSVTGLVSRAVSLARLGPLPVWTGVLGVLAKAQGSLTAPPSQSAPLSGRSEAPIKSTPAGTLQTAVEGFTKSLSRLLGSSSASTALVGRVSSEGSTRTSGFIAPLVARTAAQVTSLVDGTWTSGLAALAQSTSGVRSSDSLLAVILQAILRTAGTALDPVTPMALMTGQMASNGQARVSGFLAPLASRVIAQAKSLMPGGVGFSSRVQAQGQANPGATGVIGLAAKVQASVVARASGVWTALASTKTAFQTSVRETRTVVTALLGTATGQAKVANQANFAAVLLARVSQQAHSLAGATWTAVMAAQSQFQTALRSGNSLVNGIVLQAAMRLSQAASALSSFGAILEGRTTDQIQSGASGTLETSLTARSPSSSQGRASGFVAVLQSVARTQAAARAAVAAASALATSVFARTGTTVSQTLASSLASHAGLKSSVWASGTNTAILRAIGAVQSAARLTGTWAARLASKAGSTAQGKGSPSALLAILVRVAAQSKAFPNFTVQAPIQAILGWVGTAVKARANGSFTTSLEGQTAVQTKVQPGVTWSGVFALTGRMVLSVAAKIIEEGGLPPVPGLMVNLGRMMNRR